MKNLKQHTAQVEKACTYARNEMEVTGSNHSLPKTAKASEVINTASKLYKVSVSKLQLILQS